MEQMDCWETGGRKKSSSSDAPHTSTSTGGAWRCILLCIKNACSVIRGYIVCIVSYGYPSGIPCPGMIFKKNNEVVVFFSSTRVLIPVQIIQYRPGYSVCYWYFEVQ